MCLLNTAGFYDLSCVLHLFRYSVLNYVVDISLSLCSWMFLSILLWKIRTMIETEKKVEKRMPLVVCCRWYGYAQLDLQIVWNRPLMVFPEALGAVNHQILTEILVSIRQVRCLVVKAHTRCEVLIFIAWPVVPLVQLNFWKMDW